MSTNDLRHDLQCRLCGSSRIATVLSLRDTPLEDQFVGPQQLNVPQPLYPLQMALCEECGYAHLPHIVSPRISYTEYVYQSAVTVGLQAHYDKYAEKIVCDYKIPAGGLVVDLGSNDGSMLASFARLGYKVVGVEPATNIANNANQRGLKTINAFFDEDAVTRILNEFGPADLITANYMYANIDDVLGFTRAVTQLLAPEGIFVVQTGYHPEQIKIRMFDYIYHEHFSYFTAKVLKTVFTQCGLTLLDVQKQSPKGGSIRVVSQSKSGSRTTSASVDSLIAEEEASGMHTLLPYRTFASDIEMRRGEVLSALAVLKAKGARIVGLGASHSTTTLTYHFGLAPFLEYLVDDNSLKHGMFSPGHHIPVYSTDKLYSDKPDYVLVLAWQHQGSILERHRRFVASGGRFIVPLPELRVIGSQ